MPPVVALILCVVLVIVLLRIEHKRSIAASKALWIPTLWILISGSRPVVRWFEGNQFLSSESVQEGSSIDRIVLLVLISLALLVLFRRKINWSLVLKNNFWLILLTLYIGSSILWSDFPFVTLKRWIKSSGMILMAFVIMSERAPLQAFESALRRSAYVLIPFSIVLIKYFPNLGRQYSRWDGLLMWTGVTTHKNSLGQLCALSAFLFIWALLREWRSGDLFKNRSQSVADALVLAIALFQLVGPGGSYSATSIVILIIGITSLLFLYRKRNLTKHLIAPNLKALSVTLLLAYLLLADSMIAIFSSVLGRDETLTGRLDIWNLILDIASQNQILGIGYGSFWGLREVSFNIGVGQAHNGYLDIYLELGVVGLILLSAFLLSFCGIVRKELDHSFDWGVFGICLLPMTLLYNLSESSFLNAGYLWTFIVFVTIIFSTPRLHKDKE